MRIFIIGFMGSGKSTLGKELARRLDYRFVDMDEEIEKEQGRTINDIFQGPGESFFRKLESELLLRLIEQDNLVVSTGGGVPCYRDNMDLISNYGVSIYLEMSPDNILGRLKDANDYRPLVKDKGTGQMADFIRQSLPEREYFYKQADITVDALNVNMDDLIEKIKAAGSG